ncbi:MAG: ABC-2 family transporter protein [Treponema sp.]|nr:ABC-2 family transporter protein [Treponema sp.]
MMKALSKNLNFILLLIKFKFSRMMMFRSDFFLAFFADGALFIVQLLTFEAIYLHLDSIGGWTRGQMIIFVGTFSLINALNMVIYFFGIVDLPDKIRRGDLDKYLTKPGSPLLRLTFENFNVGSIPLIIFSILIIAYGVRVAGVEVSIFLGIGYTFFVLLMTLLWYDMELILRCITFFVLSAGGIMHIESQLIDFNFKVPGILYKGVFRMIFYFILPYGIMSTVPTQLISGSISPGGLIVSALTVIAFTTFALWFWKLGLRHYKSASS